MKQRLAKLGLARRLLFVLQTDWYQKDMTPLLINALYSVCQADFSRDETIKPVVSYLAANLHGSKCASRDHLDYLLFRWNRCLARRLASIHRSADRPQRYPRKSGTSPRRIHVARSNAQIPCQIYRRSASHPHMPLASRRKPNPDHQRTNTKPDWHQHWHFLIVRTQI